CLRYPDTIATVPSLGPEQAVRYLERALVLSTQAPFGWGPIDRPQEGSMFLIFILPNSHFPNDGFRYLEPEHRLNTTVMPGKELEITEIRAGFAPGTGETVANRVRRRYRLMKGGHQQLMLVHYTREQGGIQIPPQYLNAPVRRYPIQMSSEPRIFVLGPRAGQKVPHSNGMSAQPGGGPSIPPGLMAGAIGGTAAIAQQNATMEAMERRRQPVNALNDDIEDDEFDHLSTRSLAVARYKRNYDFMNEVFWQASHGKPAQADFKSPYSVFEKSELDSKIVSPSSTTFTQC
ncbi:hypothetical protein SISSUDRAFT_987999, partial [Sistotremastrum suecicum HHB10207 ss-3]